MFNQKRNMNPFYNAGFRAKNTGHALNIASTKIRIIIGESNCWAFESWISGKKTFLVECDILYTLNHTKIKHPCN